LPWINPFPKRFGKAPAPAASERRVPDGRRVYFVGDVHGRDDLLRQMAERVEADTEAWSFDNAACHLWTDTLATVGRGARAFESSPAAMPIARSEICLSV
jgi:hypothetical protein